MNRKGEGNIVGALIVMAIVAIVGVILMTGSAQNLSTFRDTYDVANTSLSSTNGTTGISITGCQQMLNVVAYNITTGGIVPATNYNVLQKVVSNSALESRFNVTAATGLEGYSWNVSYTCEPFGYGDSGGRALGGMIIIFGMLAIAVIVLEPTLRSKFMDAIGK